MKKISIALWAIALPTLVLAQPQTAMQSPAYKECISLSNTNPTAALTKADAWLAIDASMAAHHCRAMALYGLQRYAEAADLLNLVRDMVQPDNTALRTFVTRQTAAAWNHANRSDLALLALDSQLVELAPARGNNVGNAKLASELLLERARINIPFGKTNDAMRDLDHAVSLTPTNSDVLLERAQTFELMGDNALSRADVEAVLTINAQNAKARAMLAKLDAKPAK